MSDLPSREVLDAIAAQVKNSRSAWSRYVIPLLLADIEERKTLAELFHSEHKSDLFSGSGAGEGTRNPNKIA